MACIYSIHINLLIPILAFQYLLCLKLKKMIEMYSFLSHVLYLYEDETFQDTRPERTRKARNVKRRKVVKDELPDCIA